MKSSHRARTSNKPADKLPENQSLSNELLYIDIDNIYSYDKDPRSTKNPEHERILDSIRMQGLDQPLVVSKKPGAKRFTIQAGGNTRLSIMKSLYKSTKETRFARVPCRVRLWQGDAEAILAHLRENDIRGNLLFIERAKALMQIRQMAAKGSSRIKTTQQDFCKFLREHGYTISQPMLSFMEYAVERLLPIMPVALESGLGKPQVAKIRLLESASEKVWRARCGDTEPFAPIFDTLCRRLDSPDWHIDLLREAIDVEIAYAGELQVQSTRVLIDAELEGREPPLEQLIKPPSLADSVKPESPIPRKTGKNKLADSSLEIGSRKLLNYRREAWRSALRIACVFGISELIIERSDADYGYLITDTLELRRLSPLNDTGTALLWWHLALCAGMPSMAVEKLVDLLPESSRLRHQLIGKHTATVAQAGPEVHVAKFAAEFWCEVDDQVWKELCQLQDLHRRIYRAMHLSDDHTKE